MYKRLNALLLITLFGSSTTLYATPMKPDSLDKLIRLSNIEEKLQGNTKEMRPAYEKQAEFIIQQALSIQQLNTKQKQAAQQITDLMLHQTQQLMKNPKFTQMIRGVYQKTFTEEEAQAYIAFLSTPSGQSISKKGNVLANEIMQHSIQFAKDESKQPGQQQEMMSQLSKILVPLLTEQ